MNSRDKLLFAVILSLERFVFFFKLNLIFRSKAQVVIDDNCCLCHVAGVKYMSRMRNEDVLHASFRNHVFEVGARFFLAILYLRCRLW